MNDRSQLSSVLRDATIDALDSEVQVDRAFLLLRCVDADGDVTWAFRTTAPFNLEELLGALVVQVDVLRDRLKAEWD